MPEEGDERVQPALVGASALSGWPALFNIVPEPRKSSIVTAPALPGSSQETLPRAISEGDEVVVEVCRSYTDQNDDVSATQADLPQYPVTRVLGSVAPVSRFGLKVSAAEHPTARV